LLSNSAQGRGVHEAAQIRAIGPVAARGAPGLRNPPRAEDTMQIVIALLVALAGAGTLAGCAAAPYEGAAGSAHS
jgi:hypothetical protein